MPQSQAIVNSPKASAYLQQLCKHWAHKLDVEFTPEQGTVTIAEGAVLRLVATDGVLEMRIMADEERLATLEKVVADHLTRFAFREALVINWIRN
jgi:uncharacterized protein